MSEFPQTLVRYEHDILSDMHFVEVVPNDVYHLNDKYIQWEGRMFDEFVELFPYENIGFISDDALVGLDNIDFELRGLYFDTIYTSTIENIDIKEITIELSIFVSSNNYNSITTCSHISMDMHAKLPNNSSDIGQIDILPIAS